MASEAQKKANKKYKEKVKRITVDFTPAEADLWERVSKQPNKQGYIKGLIRADMERIEVTIDTKAFCGLIRETGNEDG